MTPRVSEMAQCTSVTLPVVIGVGSSHGDDQAGWSVVDLLESRDPSLAGFRKASVPHDALDWLEPDRPVHIIDACQEAGNEIRRFDIRRSPNGPIEVTAGECFEPQKTATFFRRLRSNSSHQFDLLSTLELAAELERLPKQVVLWTIPIAEAASNTGMAERTQELVKKCVSQLTMELHDA